jgi:hypothetical protein
MKQFIVFQICPSDACDSTCGSGVHGNYVTEISDYLDATIEYQQQAFQDMCENCNERCDDVTSCTACGKVCYQWANLGNNGYVDAANYLECQKIDVQNDDDNQNEYYVGPKCSSNGKSVKIGLFSDENCWEPVTGVNVENVIGAKLWYQVLWRVMSTSDGEDQCLSCMEDNKNNNKNANDAADADNVNEMCERVYETAAKCESPFGLENGFINVNREEEDYENQVENEFMACTFIDSLIWNSYTERGEINIFEVQDEVIRQATERQKTALSLLILAIVGIAAYGVHLHRYIERAFPDLSSQGDGQFA